MLTRKRRKEDEKRANQEAEWDAENRWLMERYRHRFDPADRPHYETQKPLSNGQPVWRYCLYCGADRFTDWEWGDPGGLLWGDYTNLCSTVCYRLFFWPPEKA